MKKLSFNNQVADDDDSLIGLLQTSTRRKPSEQFVENTLERFLALKAKQKHVHKPLKFPLYLMSVIGLILLAPIFSLLSSRSSLSDAELNLEGLFIELSLQLNSWSTLYILLLLVGLMLVVWMESGLAKFRNPFV